jgi:hypothetical protein
MLLASRKTRSIPPTHMHDCSDYSPPGQRDLTVAYGRLSVPGDARRVTVCRVGGQLAGRELTTTSGRRHEYQHRFLGVVSRKRKQKQELDPSQAKPCHAIWHRFVSRWLEGNPVVRDSGSRGRIPSGGGLVSYFVQEVVPDLVEFRAVQPTVA